MTNPVNSRRRWFATFFLLMAGGMLIWGETVLRSRLEGIGFLIYWLICFLFTGLAMFAALLDFRAVRRDTRREHAELLKDAFGDGSAKKPGKNPRR